MQKIHLTREQIKQIFLEHDLDEDGVLSISEISKAFGSLGSMIPFFKAHYGMAFADDNGDGVISFDELDKLIDYAEKFHKKSGMYIASIGDPTYLQKWVGIFEDCRRTTVKR